MPMFHELVVFPPVEIPSELQLELLNTLAKIDPRQYIKAHGSKSQLEGYPYVSIECRTTADRFVALCPEQGFVVKSFTDQEEATFVADKEVVLREALKDIDSIPNFVYLVNLGQNVIGVMGNLVVYQYVCGEKKDAFITGNDMVTIGRYLEMKLRRIGLVDLSDNLASILPAFIVDGKMYFLDLLDDSPGNLYYWMNS